MSKNSTTPPDRPKRLDISLDTYAASSPSPSQEQISEFNDKISVVQDSLKREQEERTKVLEAYQSARNDFEAVQKKHQEASKSGALAIAEDRKSAERELSEVAEPFRKAAKSLDVVNKNVATYSQQIAKLEHERSQFEVQVAKSDKVPLQAAQEAEINAKQRLDVANQELKERKKDLKVKGGKKNAKSVSELEVDAELNRAINSITAPVKEQLQEIAESIEKKQDGLKEAQSKAKELDRKVTANPKDERLQQEKKDADREVNKLKRERSSLLQTQRDMLKSQVGQEAAEYRLKEGKAKEAEKSFETARARNDKTKGGYEAVVDPEGIELTDQDVARATGERLVAKQQLRKNQTRLKEAEKEVRGGGIDIEKSTLRRNIMGLFKEQEKEARDELKEAEKALKKADKDLARVQQRTEKAADKTTVQDEMTRTVEARDKVVQWRDAARANLVNTLAERDATIEHEEAKVDTKRLESQYQKLIGQAKPIQDTMSTKQERQQVVLRDKSIRVAETLMAARSKEKSALGSLSEAQEVRQQQQTDLTQFRIDNQLFELSDTDKRKQMSRDITATIRDGKQGAVKDAQVAQMVQDYRELEEKKGKAPKPLSFSFAKAAKTQEISKAVRGLGNEITTIDEHGNNVLHEMTQKGNAKGVRKLLQSSIAPANRSTLINQRNDQGQNITDSVIASHIELQQTSGTTAQLVAARTADVVGNVAQTMAFLSNPLIFDAPYSTNRSWADLVDRQYQTVFKDQKGLTQALRDLSDAGATDTLRPGLPNKVLKELVNYKMRDVEFYQVNPAPRDPQHSSEEAKMLLVMRNDAIINQLNRGDVSMVPQEDMADFAKSLKHSPGLRLSLERNPAALSSLIDKSLDHPDLQQALGTIAIESLDKRTEPDRQSIDIALGNNPALAQCMQFVDAAKESYIKDTFVFDTAPLEEKLHAAQNYVDTNAEKITEAAQAIQQASRELTAIPEMRDENSRTTPDQGLTGQPGMGQYQGFEQTGFDPRQSQEAQNMRAQNHDFMLINDKVQEIQWKPDPSNPNKAHFDFSFDGVKPERITAEIKNIGGFKCRQLDIKPDLGEGKDVGFSFAAFDQNGNRVSAKDPIYLDVDYKDGKLTKCSVSGRGIDEKQFEQRLKNGKDTDPLTIERDGKTYSLGITCGQYKQFKEMERQADLSQAQDMQRSLSAPSVTREPDMQQRQQQQEMTRSPALEAPAKETDTRTPTPSPRPQPEKVERIFQENQQEKPQQPKAPEERAAQQQQELLAAVGDGDIRRTKALLARGVDVNTARDTDGNSALHLAASSGDERITSLLLSKDADLTALNKNGDTPYALAKDDRTKEVMAVAGKAQAQKQAEQQTSLASNILTRSLEPGVAREAAGQENSSKSSPKRDESQPTTEAKPQEPPLTPSTPSKRPVEKEGEVSTFNIQEVTTTQSSRTDEIQPIGLPKLNEINQDKVIRPLSRRPVEKEGEVSTFNIQEVTTTQSSGIEQSQLTDSSKTNPDQGTKPTSESTPAGTTTTTSTSNPEINKVGGDGRTELHRIAIANGDMAARLTNALLAQGADPNIPEELAEGKKGKTPLEYAVANGNQRVVRSLLDGGAKPFDTQEQPLRIEDTKNSLILENINKQLAAAQSRFDLTKQAIAVEQEPLPPPPTPAQLAAANTQTDKQEELRAQERTSEVEGATRAAVLGSAAGVLTSSLAQPAPEESPAPKPEQGLAIVSKVPQTSQKERLEQEGLKALKDEILSTKSILVNLSPETQAAIIQTLTSSKHTDEEELRKDLIKEVVKDPQFQGAGQEKTRDAAVEMVDRSMAEGKTRAAAAGVLTSSLAQPVLAVEEGANRSTSNVVDTPAIQDPAGTQQKEMEARALASIRGDILGASKTPDKERMNRLAVQQIAESITSPAPEERRVISPLPSRSDSMAGVREDTAESQTAARQNQTEVKPDAVAPEVKAPEAVVGNVSPAAPQTPNAGSPGANVERPITESVADFRIFPEQAGTIATRTEQQGQSLDQIKEQLPKPPQVLTIEDGRAEIPEAIKRGTDTPFSPSVIPPTKSQETKTSLQPEALKLTDGSEQSLRSPAQAQLNPLDEKLDTEFLRLNPQVAQQRNETEAGLEQDKIQQDRLNARIKEEFKALEGAGMDQNTRQATALKNAMEFIRKEDQTAQAQSVDQAPSPLIAEQQTTQQNFSGTSQGQGVFDRIAEPSAFVKNEFKSATTKKSPTLLIQDGPVNPPREEAPSVAPVAQAQQTQEPAARAPETGSEAINHASSLDLPQLRDFALKVLTKAKTNLDRAEESHSILQSAQGEAGKALQAKPEEEAKEIRGTNDVGKIDLNRARRDYGEAQRIYQETVKGAEGEKKQGPEEEKRSLLTTVGMAVQANERAESANKGFEKYSASLGISLDALPQPAQTIPGVAEKQAEIQVSKDGATAARAPQSQTTRAAVSLPNQTSTIVGAGPRQGTIPSAFHNRDQYQKASQRLAPLHRVGAGNGQPATQPGAGSEDVNPATPKETLAVKGGDIGSGTKRNQKPQGVTGAGEVQPTKPDALAQSQSTAQLAERDQKAFKVTATQKPEDLYTGVASPTIISTEDARVIAVSTRAEQGIGNGSMPSTLSASDAQILSKKATTIVFGSGVGQPFPLETGVDSSGMTTLSAEPKRHGSLPPISPIEQEKADAEFVRKMQQEESREAIKALDPKGAGGQGLWGAFSNFAALLRGTNAQATANPDTADLNNLKAPPPRAAWAPDPVTPADKTTNNGISSEHRLVPDDFADAAKILKMCSIDPANIAADSAWWKKGEQPKEIKQESLGVYLNLKYKKDFGDNVIKLLKKMQQEKLGEDTLQKEATRITQVLQHSPNVPLKSKTAEDLLTTSVSQSRRGELRKSHSI